MSVSLPERSQISACVFVLGLLCHSSLLLNAQSQASPQTKERQIRVQEPLRTASASRIDLAPKLDGTLDDPIWQQASAIDNFLQREPFDGQPSTEKTEVRVLYSKNAIYFGVTCFDSDPKRIVATELRRDVPQELDDYLELIIDSSHDRRNAYVFQINPLGTQRDALITEEQRTDSGTGDGDPGWDGVWTSEARITKQGWTATVAIPFSTLNFMQSRDVIWGINFKRFIRRKNEEDLCSGWRRAFGAARISRAGELHGMSDIGSGRLIAVETHQAIFRWVLELLAEKGLLKGKTVGIDGTTLEANAAMRSIVRRDTGEGYEEFLWRLAEESGIATPTREQLAKLDRKRAKKGSNDDWVNPHDPEAEITQLKDGRTHLAYKAEHAVDLENVAVVAETVAGGAAGDSETILENIQTG